MGNKPLARRRRRRKLDARPRSRSTITTPPKEGECRCGKPIHPTYRDRCEDCWVDDQNRWDGRSRRVRVMFNV